MKRELTRREALAGGAAVGASALMANSLIARALADPPRCGKLADIEHIVILIQENRSFDHYFGTYRGVAGFQDPKALRLHDGSGLSVFAQPGYRHGYRGDHLYPFHLDSRTRTGECTNDIDHGWTPQHIGWNHGRMDQILKTHIDPSVNGPRNGPLTMGYYSRKDLQFY